MRFLRLWQIEVALAMLKIIAMLTLQSIKELTI